MIYVYATAQHWSQNWPNIVRTLWCELKGAEEALQKVLAGLEGISLVEKKPALNPDTLFLLLEVIQNFREDSDNDKPMTSKKHKSKRSKNVPKVEEKRQIVLKHFRVSMSPAPLALKILTADRLQSKHSPRKRSKTRRTEDHDTHHSSWLDHLQLGMGIVQA